MTNQKSTKKRPPTKKSKRTRGRRKNVHQNLVYRLFHFPVLKEPKFVSNIVLLGGTLF